LEIYRKQTKSGFPYEKPTESPRLPLVHSGSKHSKVVSTAMFMLDHPKKLIEFRGHAPDLLSVETSFLLEVVSERKKIGLTQMVVVAFFEQ